MTESKKVVALGWRSCGKERKGKNSKTFEDTFGTEGYVHYLDYSADFRGVYVCQNLPKFTL